MEVFYLCVFGVLAALAGAFEFTKPKEGHMNTSRDFLRFRTNYIVVYSMMMGKDIACSAFKERALLAAIFPVAQLSSEATFRPDWSSQSLSLSGRPFRVRPERSCTFLSRTVKECSIQSAIRVRKGRLLHAALCLSIWLIVAAGQGVSCGTTEVVS